MSRHPSRVGHGVATTDNREEVYGSRPSVSAARPVRVTLTYSWLAAPEEAVSEIRDVLSGAVNPSIFASVTTDVDIEPGADSLDDGDDWDGEAGEHLPFEGT